MNQIPKKNTLLEFFNWRVKQSSDDIVFKFNDREMTYREYDSKANSVAQGIIKEDCKPNARIAILAKNSDYYTEILYGTIKSRTVLVGINWRLAPPEVVFVVNDSKSEILFVGPDFYKLIEGIEDQLPSIKKIVAMDDSHPVWESYTSWRDGQNNNNPDLTGNLEDDVIQLYTSGTTGHPKGVRMTNKNLLASTPMVEKRWGADWHEKTVNFVLSPLFHVAGSNIVVMGVVFGCKNIIIPEPDPTRILELIESEKIETAFMVPALILFLLQHPNCSKTDFSSLRQIVYGASPIAQDTLLKAVEVMQCDFWQVYGLTESTGIGTTLSPSDHNIDLGKLRSCGKPYPGVNIKIIDESNNTLEHNEVGEILIKSDVIMKGYWNRPDANEDAIIDEWFYTGDAGYIDEDGFLYIHDRVKDMIISGGENIYPAEVENALMSHPDIADAAAVGIPDDKWGETVKGFVILKQDSNITEKEIIAYAKDQIAAYKCPSSIDFITEMPRNPSGKILRRELRAPFWDDAERNVS